MSPKPWKRLSAALGSTALGLILSMTAAEACNTSGGGSVSIYKPVTINKSVNIYKPTTINKSVNIYKPVTINKTIDASKNITINKNVEINKSIVINKGGSSSAEASAWAAAWASASASASAGTTIVYGGNYNEYVTVNNRSGEIGAIGATVQASSQCEIQDATVVKAVHAVCISPDGHEFPASHMVGDTWLDSGYEGEVLRCIPGAHLKITLGDVLQSDQGLAGTFASGQTLECGPGEALRHLKDGMLKCMPKLPVKDCTERSNLRRWGSGDMFFSFRTRVCVPPKITASHTSREIELSGMSMSGGVGDQ